MRKNTLFLLHSNIFDEEKRVHPIPSTPDSALFLDSFRRFPVKLAHGLGPKPICRGVRCAHEKRAAVACGEMRARYERTRSRVSHLAPVSVESVARSRHFSGENKGTIRFAWPSAFPSFLGHIQIRP